MCYVDVSVRTSLCTITSGVDGDDVDHTSVYLLVMIMSVILHLYTCCKQLMYLYLPSTDAQYAAYVCAVVWLSDDGYSLQQKHCCVLSSGWKLNCCVEHNGTESVVTSVKMVLLVMHQCTCYC